MFSKSYLIAQVQPDSEAGLAAISKSSSFEAMFDKSAAYYDLIYTSLKDYEAEARRLHDLLQQFEPIPKKLLDVGCGTGEHAYHLSQLFDYEVDGIDLEAGLIEQAAQKNARGDFTVGDMRNFSLPQRYDALVCLFSTIGYAHTLGGLEQAAACFGKHLVPGGWLIIEPWLAPDEWEPGQIDAQEFDDPISGVHIVRARASETQDNVSILKMDYHIKQGTKERTLSEVHKLGLFTSDQILEIFGRHGFAIKKTDSEATGKPLYLACYTP